MASSKKVVEIVFESDSESENDISMIDSDDSDNQTWTITLSERVENHVGMQMIGKMSPTGFSISEMETFQTKCENDGFKTEMIDLEKNLHEDLRDNNPSSSTVAKILIIRSGVKMLMKNDYKDFIKEVKSSRHIVDKKAWMRGRVVNKLARYNLCYGETSQKPDYENKKGTIVAFKDVPLLSKLRDKIGEVFCQKSKNLLAELNYYYDIKNTGIGFHGDSERRLVIGVRVGSQMNLEYQWFQQGIHIGERIKLLINEGDIYIMSEKSTGTDWKKRIIPTLRHAAGCKKYTDIKSKVPKKPKD